MKYRSESLPSSVTISYRTGWVREGEESLWLKFHRQWWGPSGRTCIAEALRTDHFLHILKGLFGLLNSTNGAVYVRKEYQSFYLRLKNARAKLEASDMTGALLLGQPGIGKSFFLVYLLLEILSQEETVLLTISSGDTLLFDESGVYIKPAHEINDARDLPPFRRTWSLVDCPNNKQAIPGKVSHLSARLFWVATLSPDESRYTEALKQTTTRVWWMSPWTVEEICSLTSQPPFSGKEGAWKTLPTVEDSVRALREQVGPCPRDIITKVVDGWKYEKGVFDALQAYDALPTIVSLIRNDAAPGPSNRHSHNIILVQRVGAVSETSYGSDKTSVTLKTQYITQRVMDKFISLELEEAKQLFTTCSGIGPRGAVFVGHLFEGLAIRYTSGECSEDLEAVGPFTLMTQVDSQGTKFPVRFRYRAAGHTLTVVVNEAGRTAWRISPPTTSATPDNRQQTPWAPRMQDVYNDDTMPIINNTSYYRPRSSNNPLFDAFFYQVSETKVILWVIQITKQRDHDGSSKGFAIVDKLKKVAQNAKDLPVEVKYVLVVPQGEPGWDAEWNFAPEFWEQEGEVFLQQLKVSVRRGGHWSAEDFFGPAIAEIPVVDDVSTEHPPVVADKPFVSDDDDAEEEAKRKAELRTKKAKATSSSKKRQTNDSDDENEVMPKKRRSGK